MTARTRGQNVARPRCFPAAGILPPHILWAIVANGDAEQRAWALQALAVSERIRGRRELLGDIATAAAAAAPGKQRTVYDARHGSQLPGAKVRGEGDPPGTDVAVNEAYDGAGATYDLYHDVFGRNSIDDRGMPLDRHRPLPAELRQRLLGRRARWCTATATGRSSSASPSAVDVIGHELTHGVTQYEASLDYADQPGALNESFSDVFGSLVKQRTLGQTADAGRLADRRRPVHAGDPRRGAALDEGAGHRLRRPAARQGPAARAHGALRRRRPTTTAASTSTPAFPTARSTWRRSRSAASPGRRRARSGTSRCATGCGRLRTSRPRPPRRPRRPRNCSARAAGWRRPSPPPGNGWG